MYTSADKWGRTASGYTLWEISCFDRPASAIGFDVARGNLRPRSDSRADLTVIATAFHFADQRQIDLFDEIRMGVQQGKQRNTVATFQTLHSQSIATTAGDS